jgi:hypothetical protein
MCVDKFLILIPIKNFLTLIFSRCTMKADLKNGTRFQRGE